MLYHHQILFKRADSPEAFVKSHARSGKPNNIDNIITNLTAKISKATYLWLPEERIPADIAYLTCSTKFHKDPVAYRYITPAHNSAITPVAKLVGKVLTFLLAETFPRLCNEEERRILRTHGTKVKLNWRCTSINQFILNMPSHAESIFGADAEKCYEKPPLKGKNGMTEAVDWFVNLAML